MTRSMFELPPAPRMSGGLLRSVVAATSAEPVRRALAAFMRKELGIEAALALPASRRARMPLSCAVVAGRAPREVASAELGEPAAPTAIPSAAAWHARYAAGDADPVTVTERALAEARRLAAARPTMSCMSVIDDAGAVRDAEASAARWKKGAPLGPLDGVVVPVKEEVDLEGIGFRLGTQFVEPNDAAVDATSVARLRAAGAILLGHTIMTEMGMSPLGGNVQRPMPRNAHAIDRLAGGSSTGSAVAVASGLCPVALGSDGGGSVRIPSSFNGLFGIKPTFGRISRHGDGFDGTMDHLGPLGASTRDLAIFLEVAGGEDPLDPLTHGSPAIAPGSLVAALGRGVRGLRVGVLGDEIAVADAAVQDACREALAQLERDGAVLVDVSLPLAEHAPGIGYLTIGLETYASLLGPRRDAFDRMGPDLQLLMRLLSTFGSGDYLDAQSLRGALRAECAAALLDVDVLAMPTTVSVAPEVTALDLEAGFADTPALHAACRFAFVGNLTGLPCGTAPVGSGEAGLPVGLQIVGDAFDEASVLAVLAHLERSGVASVRAPRVPVYPLGQ